MSINWIEIIVVVFALFAWSRALLRFKARKLSQGSFVFWSWVWICALVVVFIPSVPAFFSTRIGIRRPVDIAVYASIVLLFYMVFRIYVQLDHMEQEITKIVREITLRKKDKK